jgi:superfamily II DNA or RNA helicase
MLNPPPSHGRDRRRRLSTEEQQLLYARWNGLCANCGNELGADWHGAHMAAYALGGATELEDMRPQCPKCNLRFGPGVMEQVEGFHPRVWQQVAFRRILLRLWESGSATLHAAPGAGKTLFAAVLFRHLRELGIAERAIIFVPNSNLVGQTVKAYKKIGIHLDEKPRDSTIEHPETVGLVVCYQSLSAGAVRSHITRMLAAGTLVIFDEVHHLADQEHSAWGAHVENMVGRVSDGPPLNAVAVLNMTGTLFRSSSTQRISTVRYRRIGEDTHEAIADHSVTTAELVGTELRAPDLYIYGGKATLIDLEEEQVIEAEIVDLSQRQRSAVAREMFRSEQWLTRYATEGLRLLTSQLEAVRHEVPLKALHVADDQPTAAVAVKIYNALARAQGVGYDIAVPVYTESPGSAQRLKDVRHDPRPRVIVTCQMVTEGFDCPDLSVLVHATRKAALLFVAQVMARVMRITDYERAAGMMLPAQILIPDSPVLKDSYAAAIAAAGRVVHEETVERCHRQHPRTKCPCLFPHTECLCSIYEQPPKLRRYDVLSVDDPRLDGATVLGHEDGHVPVAELDHWIRELRKLVIPEPFAPKIAVLVRRSGGTMFRGTGEPDTAATPVPTQQPASPRDLSDTYRARLRKAAGFMEKHIGHDAGFRTVGEFQGKVNDAAGIPSGGRDLATVRQLSTASSWACAHVRRHCETHGERAPDWAEGMNRG